LHDCATRDMIDTEVSIKNYGPKLYDARG